MDTAKNLGAKGLTAAYEDSEKSVKVTHESTEENTDETGDGINSMQSKKIMIQDQTALVWLDMEMTGLSPEKDKIIELAVIVTNSKLEQIGEGQVWVVHQPKSVMDKMDEWNIKHHGKSGLIDRVQESKLKAEDVEAQCLQFLKRLVPKGKSPMCGNSICQDRRFMARYMPRLEEYFHYRNLDVSTLKELCQRWAPEIAKGFKKVSKHQALSDIQESIDELRYYREQILKI